MRRLTPEEAERIAQEYGVTVKPGTKVETCPSNTFALGADSHTRHEAVARSRRVYQRHIKFKAAERKRRRAEVG